MQKGTQSLVLGVLVLALSAGLVLAAEAGSPQSWVGDTLEKCCWGGDIRIRQSYFDEIPIIVDPPGVTRGGENNFFRFRTRLWGQFDPSEDVTVKGRIVNEWREVVEPSTAGRTDVSTWEFPDELIVDQLYLEIRNLLDGDIDVRVGRQDLIYGTGKLILEGTPKDGSRTIYMDAAKLTYKGIENTTVDLFGIYNQSENDLGVNDFDNSGKRDIVGYDKYFNDVVESGGGIYIKNKSIETMPYEAYYIFKDESDWDSQTADGAVVKAGQEIHTLGFRVMPTLADGITASIEAAVQNGEIDGGADLEAWMADAVVNMSLPILEKIKPSIGAGVYYLSGDDPNTSENEAWNPLWARWPQYSELYVYAWDAEGAANWANVMMPHIDLSFAPWKGAKTTAMLGYLTAPEETGPGTGDERGWLATMLTDFTLAREILTDSDVLKAHLLVEVLDPGNYYNVDNEAVFARWELMYVF